VVLLYFTLALHLPIIGMWSLLYEDKFVSPFFSLASVSGH